MTGSIVIGRSTSCPGSSSLIVAVIVNGALSLGIASVAFASKMSVVPLFGFVTITGEASVELANFTCVTLMLSVAWTRSVAVQFD